MWDTASRTLELIARLDGRAPQGARTLAEQLGVTERTVRRDVARLRDLGYPIDTTRGPDGGYSLEYGAALPPISMTFDEAIVCTLALQGWSGSRDEMLTMSAMGKVAAALPQKVRLMAAAVDSSTRTVSSATMFQPSSHATDPALIGVLARACARNVCVRFDYQARGRDVEARRAEPYMVMNANRRWYLVAYDLDRAGWRTFRVDRISACHLTETPILPHPLPADDMEAWVVRQIATGLRQVKATVRIHLPAEAARQFIAPVWGDLTPETPSTCLASIGSDDYASIARWLMLLDADIDVIDCDDLADAFLSLSKRAARAAGGKHD